MISSYNVARIPNPMYESSIIRTVLFLPSISLITIMKYHNTFQDRALEELSNPNGPGYVYTGQVRQRLFLVLDCLTAHQFSEKGHEFINLQQFVTKMKRVPERDALVIFYDIVKVVAHLHKVITAFFNC